MGNRIVIFLVKCQSTYESAMMAKDNWQCQQDVKQVHTLSLNGARGRGTGRAEVAGSDFLDLASNEGRPKVAGTEGVHVKGLNITSNKKPY
jgi:hypothetical protein